MENLFKSLETIKLGTISLSSILSAVLLFIVSCIVIRILCRAVEKLLDKSAHIDASLKGFLRSACKIALWVIAIIIIADSVGIPVTSLVAVLSVAGLALSLSVQGLLSNLFSGITLLITRPFVVGDFVELSGNCGTVKEIGLFYTTVCTIDNKVISVPNGDITGSNIVNYTREKLRRVDIAINASYKCATEDVRNAILEAVAMDPKALREPAPFVAISSYGTSTVEYTVRVWCNSADYWDVFFALNENIRTSFANCGVEMSYDHLNVHMVND